MEAWTALGKHRYCIIAQQLRLQSQGEFTPQEADALMDLLDALRDRHPKLTILFDSRSGLSAPSATRRVFVQRSQGAGRSIPTAVVGAGIVIRTLFRLTLDAIRLMSGRDIPLEFFASEADALTWLGAFQ